MPALLNSSMNFGLRMRFLALLNLGMIHSLRQSLKFRVGAIHELPLLNFGGKSYSKSATPDFFN